MYRVSVDRVDIYDLLCQWLWPGMFGTSQCIAVVTPGYVWIFIDTSGYIGLNKYMSCSRHKIVPFLSVIDVQTNPLDLE